MGKPGHGAFENHPWPDLLKPLDFLLLLAME